MSGEMMNRLRGRVLRQGMSVLFIMVILTVLVVMGKLVPGVEGHAAEAGQPATPTSEQPDPQRLVGRWVRPDGGYILDVREVVKEGRLKAAYFNPRPINLAKSEWREKDGALTVFVELRDVNYPGSTYTLQYDRESDRLKGTYYQAVEKQTFRIEFARGR
jgi:hypothetical protein